MQVYLILDEFIMGGELQETSKKVRAQQGLALAVWSMQSTGADQLLRRSS